MRRVNWSRIFYILSIILMLAGVWLKISKQDGWQILFIISAAAMGGNFEIEQFTRNRGMD